MFPNQEQPKLSQQEKTPQELKQEAQSLIDELNLVIDSGDLEKAEALQLEVKKRIKVLEEKIGLSPEIAREILGENFYGPEEIESAFGFKVDKSEIPKIPYSREVLEQAEKLGERLILRISHDGEGNPMTMERISRLGQARMKEINFLNNESLNNKSLYEDEYFYKYMSLKTEWKLVGGSFVKGSQNNNYFHQTRVLRDYLKSINSLTAEEEIDCSDEILKQLSEQLNIDWDTQKFTLGAKVVNWREVAFKLTELKVNKNHRRTPTEILYDWFLEFKKTKSSMLLDDCDDWSNILSSDNFFVCVRAVEVYHVSIHTSAPYDKYCNSGVISVR